MAPVTRHATRRDATRRASLDEASPVGVAESQKKAGPKMLEHLGRFFWPLFIRGFSIDRFSVDPFPLPDDVMSFVPSVPLAWAFLFPWGCCSAAAPLLLLLLLLLAVFPAFMSTTPKLAHPFLEFFRLRSLRALRSMAVPQGQKQQNQIKSISPFVPMPDISEKLFYADLEPRRRRLSDS